MQIVGSTRRVPVDIRAHRCELAGGGDSPAPVNCRDVVHLLWTDINSPAAPNGPPALALSLLARFVVARARVAAKVRNIELRPAVDEAIGVVKVVRSREQVGVSPDCIPAGHAALGSQALPDRCRLAQPAGAQFQSH